MKTDKLSAVAFAAWAFWALFSISAFGGVVWAIIHFTRKFW